MSKIQVTLVTAAKPPVTVSPHDAVITPKHDTIKWVRAANQTFKFCDVHFSDPNAPFSPPVISDHHITTDDDNRTAHDYAYVLSVIGEDGKHYSTATQTLTGGPTIKNK